MSRTSIQPETRAKARRLRSEMTVFEVRLWSHLRQLTPYGARFRRQAPIGPYIVDFAWLSGRLVIELDGDQHAEAQAGYDRVRDDWLRSRGFEVVRFWNADVKHNYDGVVEVIYRKIVAHGANPTPPAVPAADPPRKGEGAGRRLPRRTRTS